MRLSFGILPLVVTLFCSCSPKVPISSIHRDDITSVTLGDCASKNCSIDSTRLIDDFWLAISTSRKGDIDHLKDNTGFARVWVHLRDGRKVADFRIVASSKYGAVIDNHGERLICDQCDEFFNGLRELHPEFNWCQAPRIH